MLVVPCRSVLGIEGNTIGDRSEWLWTSTNPGTRVRPAPPTVSCASGPAVPSCPTHAMRSPAKPTAPANPGAPVPSTIVTSVIRTSSTSGVGEEDAEGRAAAGAFLEPGAAAVELGETADE